MSNHVWIFSTIGNGKYFYEMDAILKCFVSSDYNLKVVKLRRDDSGVIKCWL